MLRLFFILLLVSAATGVSAQDAAVIQLPFDIELNKPITVKHRLILSKDRTTSVTEETNILIPLSVDENELTFSVETQDGDLVRSEGVPRFIEPVMLELSKRKKGLKYQYSADTTGTPSHLKNPDAVQAFMKGMQNELMSWCHRFIADNNLSDREHSVLNRVADNTLSRYLTKDLGQLNRLVLGPTTVMFFPTGRQLYLDYVTEVKSVRYFEPGKTYFHMADKWVVDGYDLKKGLVKVSFKQALDPQEFQKFLTRMEKSLTERYGEELREEIETELDKFRKLSLNRTGRYTIDLGSGLPIKGEVVSEQIFFDKLEIEELYFTMSY